MQIMLVFEIQILVHQIQPVDFWFNISYSDGDFVKSLFLNSWCMHWLYNVNIDNVFFCRY